MPDPLGGFAYTWPLYATAVVAYLLGSIPFGLLLAKLFKLGDLRLIGSGNIGATNVLRTGNMTIAAATLLGDMLKGAAAVLIASRWDAGTALAAGLGAFLGHLYPFWLKFRGGKGVATYLGILLGLHWPTMILAGLIWLATAAIFRFSSLSAMIASAATPLMLYSGGHVQAAELFLLLTIILWFRHRANIRRLISGTEGRIGAK